MTEIAQDQEFEVEGQVQQDQTSQNGWPVACLTIGDCGPFYEKIKEAMAKGEKIQLDLSVCQEIDTAGLQLLAAIQIDPEVSLKVRWSEPSKPIKERAARLGLSSWIESGALGV